MPDHGLEDIRLLADLVRAGGRNANALGVDHFAHDAARAVRGADECLRLYFGQVRHRTGAMRCIDLRRRDLLQTAEERVTTCIRARQESGAALRLP